LRVTLYTKTDCGLCVEAEDLLRRLQKRIHFELEFVNLETSDSASVDYGERVPVVLVDGREVAAAPIDERELLAALTR
jgi:glutaredoxin